MEQYFNDGQRYVLTMQPRDLVVCAGRGFGKGIIQGTRILQCMQMMPRSSGGMVGPSVKRLLTNILPSMLQHLERWGYKRDVHYTIGHRPPAKLKWDEPLIYPENWENTLSFYNGSVINLISQDRKGTSNSMSLDWLSIDEAKFIDFEQLKNETFQANRGQEMFFKKCHLHHGMTVTSDMPLTKSGSWFMKYEKEMNPELITYVEALVYRQWQLMQSHANGKRTEWTERNLREVNSALLNARRHALLFKRYTSIDNVQVLGIQYIKRMKRDLPRLTFLTSVMCQDIGVATDGFYSCMKRSNKYTAPNVNFIDNLEFDKEKLAKPDSRWDADCDPNQPLIISLDANANINWLCVGQTGTVDGRPCLRFLKSFYVKYERKIPELLDDFNEYYRYHRQRRVIFYYDATFVGNNYALQNEDFHNYICTHLRRLGWLVQDVFIGRPMKHTEKQLLINRMLQGRARFKVLFNEDNNPDLLISIESAGVYNGQKDKRGEKLVETEEDKLEGRTDGSDAADTMMIGTEKFPKTMSSGAVVVSSFSS